ncbi:MAG TPA: NAD-dependent epimerase/dehydratase family protein [Kofleriaceae bacterium]|nr:NAD-dependent epimerase/dehydratase family protein [Kofleriaceae bacterium]
MNVAVTGVAGFIGSHTAEALVARGHRVLGIDAFDDFLYAAKIKRSHARGLAARLPAKAFRLAEVDICDGPAIARELATEGIEVVCHLAALAGVRPSIEDPKRYIRTNLDGTGAVLEACRNTGIDRVVFASSSSVYGARGAGQDLTRVAAFREDDPCLRPASPYAATKRAGELLCSTYVDLFGLGISALRYFTVYGPRQRPDMAIHKFARAIRDGRPVVLFGDGSSRRDYTFIDDIVAGTVAAIERVTPARFEIYNLGGTHTTSLAELVGALEAGLGKRAIREHRPDQPGDVPLTFAAIDRAREDLAYEPKIQLADGIDAFVRWLSQDGDDR